jgi:hypothetical protein
LNFGANLFGRNVGRHNRTISTGPVPFKFLEPPWRGIGKQQGPPGSSK